MSNGLRSTQLDCAREVRALVRNGEFRRQTSGITPGVVQGNVAIMPREFANDFLQFCRLNPKPCPLLAVTVNGSALLPELGEDVDVRTDVPMYRVFRDGEIVEDVPDIRHLWSSDLVAFVLGCSFSFEEALIEAGVPLKHIENKQDVSIYRTNVETRSAGPFSGPLVVSMRPFTPANAIRAVQITTRFPGVHGAPIHIGDPKLIGVADISKPEWGDVTKVEADEIPLFWACGVTPQAVIARARIPLFITHKPSHMLVTDKLNSDLAIP